MSAVVMLSGGQDSSTCLAIANQEHEKVTAVIVDYGQNHRKEIMCAAYQAAKFSDEFFVVEINPKLFGKRPLMTGEDIPENWDAKQGPAPTIIPGRNAILLSIGAAAAEARGYDQVYCGVSEVDSSGYPDCRQDFIIALEDAIQLSSQGKVTLRTPLISLPKTKMIQIGTELGVDWEHTWTCYRGETLACGRCPSCKLRLAAFEELGMVDPLEYQKVEVDVEDTI